MRSSKARRSTGAASAGLLSRRCLALRAGAVFCFGLPVRGLLFSRPGRAARPAAAASRWSVFARAVAWALRNSSRSSSHLVTTGLSRGDDVVATRFAASASKTAATHERRNDDAAVESARERYLARKRQREGGS